MPTSGEVIRGISNVQMFIEATTLHSQGLVRDGYIWTDPVPMFLRPYTEVSQGFPHNRVVRNDFILGVSKGRVIHSQDRAPFGERDIYGVEMLEPLEIAGHSMTVTTQDVREAMMESRISQMITQPAEEWFRACNEIALDNVLMGAFSNGSNDPSDSFTPNWETFDNTTVNYRMPTDTADTAKPLTANSNHLVTFANRNGGTFAAGHDHTRVGVGGAWTRARGRTERDLITEHSGQNAVDSFVGATVAAAIKDVLESGSGLDSSGVAQLPSGTAFLAAGRNSLVSADFGVPIALGTVDEVQYWHVTDIPTNIGLMVARGSRPFRGWVGLRTSVDEVESPFAWSAQRHREIRGANDNAGVDYGYRGHFRFDTQNPVGTVVTEFTA